METFHWDVFLAYPSADSIIAEELYELLKQNIKVFLDSKCLLPGDDWDTEIIKAQRNSFVTVILISENSNSAYYQREEIARAIYMSRNDEKRHRVVPLFLNSFEPTSDNMPYGLLLKKGLRIEKDIKGTAEKIFNLFSTLTQSTDESVKYADQNIPPNNLPRRTRLIDRKNEKAGIVSGLNSLKPIVSIEGLGGMGKTVLAVDTAYEALTNSTLGLGGLFNACVFVTAKRPITLNNLLDAISRVLNYPYLTQLPLKEKEEKTIKILQENRTLIVADNLETVTDPLLLEFLMAIPEPSKVLATTRDRNQLSNKLKWRIGLDRLKEGDAIELVRSEADALDLSKIANAEEQELAPLIYATGGNPFAIETALGLYDAGIAWDTLVKALIGAEQHVKHIFDEIFPWAWEVLNSDARKILVAMSFFDESAGREVLRAISKVESYAFDIALSQLMRMALITGNDAFDEDTQRFTIHPLTLAFAKAKLSEEKKLEKNLRELWTEWYLDFAIQNITINDWWDGMQDNHHELDSEWKNIILVFKWCRESNLHIEKIRQFWLDDSLSEFTKSYGYWGDQIEWLKWILESALAESYNDQENKRVIAASISGIIWALTRTGNLRDLVDANNLVKIAWNYESDLNPALISRLADDTAVLNIQQKKWEEALTFFEKALLNLEKAEMDIFSINRKKCHIMYYKAVYHLERGEKETAEKLFREGLKFAEDGRWRRAAIFFNSHLVDIEIDKGNLREAEKMLSNGLSAAERIKDVRAIAIYKYSSAVLEGQKGNTITSIENAQQALNGFVRLSMKGEIQKTQTLLDDLSKMHS